MILVAITLDNSVKYEQLRLCKHEGTPMSDEDFIRMTSQTVIDDRYIDELRKRLNEAETAFENEARDKAVDDSFLARTYSL